MRFAIRDDDTCFFTRPEEIEGAYRDIAPHVPVSLAVTPFAVSCSHLGDIERFRQGDTPFALRENRDLVAWLRQGVRAGRWSVLCHGCTHEYRREGPRRLTPEYAWKPRERLIVETEAARRHLEMALGWGVSTFVPPGNAMSSAGRDAVARSFSRVLATIPLRRWTDLRLEADYLRAYGRRLIHQLRRGGPCPQRESAAGLEWQPCHSLTRAADWQALRASFDQCRTAGADFVVAVHYWELDSALRDRLRRLVDCAAAAGCRFVHCDALFSAPARRGRDEELIAI